MKITTYILIFFYIIFLLNGVSVLCEPEGGVETKKKKKKKKPVTSANAAEVINKQAVNEQPEMNIPATTPSDEFTEAQIQEAREVLARVMEAEEVKKVTEKKKKKKMIAITVTAVLGALALISALGVGGYFCFKKKKVGPENLTTEDTSESGEDLSQGQSAATQKETDPTNTNPFDSWPAGKTYPSTYPDMER